MKHYYVVLQLESGAVVMWQGLAEDERHAEGMSTAAQTEQVYAQLHIGTAYEG